MTLNGCVTSSLFKAYNSNKDKKLNKKEYIGEAKSQDKTKLKQEFDKFDVNGDGYLTKEEFKASIFK